MIRFTDMTTASQDTKKKIAEFCKSQRDAILRNGRDEFAYKVTGGTMAELRLHIEKQLPDNIGFDEFGLWQLAWIKDPYAYMEADPNAFDKDRISKQCNDWRNLKPVVRDGVQKKTTSRMWQSAVETVKEKARKKAEADRKIFAKLTGRG